MLSHQLMWTKKSRGHHFQLFSLFLFSLRRTTLLYTFIFTFKEKQEVLFDGHSSAWSYSEQRKKNENIRSPAVMFQTFTEWGSAVNVNKAGSAGNKVEAALSTFNFCFGFILFHFNECRLFLFNFCLFFKSGFDADVFLWNRRINLDENRNKVVLKAS